MPEESKPVEIYLPNFDTVLIFDNSEGQHEFLADKELGSSLNIVNTEKFNLLKITMTTTEKQLCHLSLLLQ